MPFAMRKNRGKDTYYVINTVSKHKFSKGATYKNAKKQLFLLRGLQYNKEGDGAGAGEDSSTKNKTRKIKSPK